MKIFLTGATGFVGSGLLQRFVANGVGIEALVRDEAVVLPDGVQKVVGDLAVLGKEKIVGSSPTMTENLKPEDNKVFVQDDASRNDCVDCRATLAMAMREVDVVVHVAARAHIMREALAEYRKVNRDATLTLARLAAEASVKRFVFLSSIGVNGNNSQKPFTEEDETVPNDLYAISKLEAEQGLLQIAKETDMEVVIIRPPLVYGANAPGNFGSLMKWMRKGIPLPFGAIHNQRSLVALDNLVDFIALCADREKSPKAANEVFLISDAEDVSTTELLQKVAKAQNKQAWLLPVPVGLMTFFARLLGKGAVANRLFGSLQVDSFKARDLLGWKPVTTMDEQLAKMAGAEKKVKKT